MEGFGLKPSLFTFKGATGRPTTSATFKADTLNNAPSHPSTDDRGLMSLAELGTIASKYGTALAHAMLHAIAVEWIKL